VLKSLVSSQYPSACWAFINESNESESSLVFWTLKVEADDFEEVVEVPLVSVVDTELESVEDEDEDVAERTTEEGRDLAGDRLREPNDSDEVRAEADQPVPIPDPQHPLLLACSTDVDTRGILLDRCIPDDDLV